MKIKYLKLIILSIVNFFSLATYATDNIPITFAHNSSRINFFDGNTLETTLQTFKVSPDEKYAVFSDVGSNFISNPDLRTTKFYSVSIEGGNPKKIYQSNDDEAPLIYLITPDSSKVITYTQATALSTGKITSTPINGGNTIELATFTRQPFSVFNDPEPVISPDGSHIVYTDYNSSIDFGRSRLFSVSIATGQKTLLSSSIAEIDGKILISPDSKYVVFRSDREVLEQFELYSVPISGGSLVKLNSNFSFGSDVSAPFRNGFGGYAITPDSNNVVYVADQTEDGIDISRLFQISPNGQFIVYRTDTTLDNIFEIYSIPFNGGQSKKLSDPNINVGTFVDSNFIISSDSQRVVYRKSDARDSSGESQSFNLFSTPINSDNSVQLNDPILGGNISRFLVTPDGQKVVFSGVQDTLGIEELYSTQISQSQITKLNQPLSAAKNVSSTSFELTPDGLSVLYRADAVIDQKFELYRNTLDGENLTKVSHELPEDDQDAWRFYASNNNDFTLYIAFGSRVSNENRKETIYLQSDILDREPYMRRKPTFIPSIFQLLLDEWIKAITYKKVAIGGLF